MRSVQSQQPREMRINTEPLRRQDTKNVRMRHQQHIVSSVEQRFDRGDRWRSPHVCAPQLPPPSHPDRCARAPARRSAKFQSNRLPTIREVPADRRATHPKRNRPPHSLPGAYALRHGRNPIPRFQGAHRNRHIRPAAPSAGLCATDWRTCTPARNPGETPHATVRRRHEPDRSQCQSTEYWCGRCAVRIRSTRSARDAAAPSGQG